jgi:AcrR family transcriptional regulator
MSRNGEDVHRRLQQAALELFSERGYDQTTAAEIAARAGVTERTYFRHFPDKRDILFGEEQRLQSLLTETIEGAPAGLGPMSILKRAFDTLGAIFEANRPFSGPRLAVIASTPALREREMSKQAGLIVAVATALAKRGVDPRTAGLVAQLGAVAFNHALATWADDPTNGLGVHLDRTLEQIRLLSS